MDRRGVLAAFVTAAYPAPRLVRWIEACGLSRVPSVQRFVARAAPVSGERVHALWAGEPFSQFGNRVRGVAPWTGGWADRLDLLARGLYAAGAARLVRGFGGVDGRCIYHYRSGFGGGSVEAARRRGWICLCHHTIAHPAVLAHLVTHGGRLPPAGQSGPIDRNWRAILADVDRADHVCTESEFARSTFIHQGWGADRITALPQGIDDEFLAGIPERVAPPGGGPLRLLFAGSFGRRKGGPVLAEALSHLGENDGVDWRLDLCGPVDPDAAADFRRLSADPRVTYHGTLSSSDLAARMTAAEVFVFPTLAEGSARVQFEALAAGCYLVTTPNGGSIVVDGEHGALIEPGSVRAIVDAIRHAASGRPRVARIGACNAALVRRDWREADYGARMLDLYERLSRAGRQRR